MRTLGYVGLTVAFVMALGAGAASAGTITNYSGQDDGAGINGPFPNSSAAQASFLSAASGYGLTRTETFEELAVGTGTGGGTFGIAGGSVTLNVNPFCGVQFCGVSNSIQANFSNLYGFNVTPGGANWLGFSGGSATFNFTHATHSFGFWTTGVQTFFTSLLTVTFNDGTREQLDLPINVNGGASYFGFTDSTAFKSITIADFGTANGTDAWGIDDVSYNFGSPVPEPMSIAILGAGLAGLGGWRLRRKAKAA